MSARTLSADVARSIIDAITRPLRHDEGHKTGNDNKEREIRAMFALLTASEALALRRRLAADRTSDELVAAFKRLTMERRTRLLAFLSDPRRGRL